jgi:tetratricopeptide (TPR) repeat protein
MSVRRIVTTKGQPRAARAPATIVWAFAGVALLFSVASSLAEPMAAQPGKPAQSTPPAKPTPKATIVPIAPAAGGARKAGKEYSAAARVRNAAILEGRDFDSEIAQLTQAIAASPYDAILYARRGVGYNMKGDYALAMQDLNKAIAMNPNLAGFYNVASVCSGKVV